MPIKPVAAWKKRISPTAERDQISTFAIDTQAGAIRSLVNDTVIERRGSFPDYRPGDIGKMLKGTVFQR